MARKFELFHLSLIVRDDLFARRMSREAWLREQFSQPFNFEHRSIQLVWVPRQESVDQLVGLIERLVEREHHLSPDEGGEETSSMLWEGIYVVLDPTHHLDGQKLAVEVDLKVGRPAPVLESLVRHINKVDGAPYEIFVEPIFDGASFREFSEAHGHRMKTVKFDFVVPNMFDSAGELDVFLKETGQETGARRVKMGLESEDGVKSDAPQVQEAVDYCEKGAGKVRAEAMNGDVYTSDDRSATTAVEDDPPGNPMTPSRERQSWFKRILGRG